jgi:anti-sigma factor RsiW
MTQSRGWGLPEQHLLPDAVVAFVDGELSAGAHDRAAAHLARCPMCAADTAAQRQARDAVRAAEIPGAPAGLLAALRSIPVDTDLPGGPEGLAMTADGQLVTIQRPDRAGVLGGGPMLGSSTPLGAGNTVLSARSPYGRRAVQGAGVVAVGLVLGAMAVMGPHAFGGGDPAANDQAHRGGGSAATDDSLLQANFAAPLAEQSTAVSPAVNTDVVTPGPALRRSLPIRR